MAHIHTISRQFSFTLSLYLHNMRPVIIEALSYFNDGFQTLGLILIGFKIVFAFLFTPTLTSTSSIAFSISDLRYVASEAIISVILLTINLIFAITATQLLKRAEPARKYVALLLLGISQLLIGLVIILNIAAAVIERQITPLQPANYFVLNIVTILYYLLIVVLSQGVLMVVVIVIKYEKAKPTVVTETS